MQYSDALGKDSENLILVPTWPRFDFGKVAYFPEARLKISKILQMQESLVNEQVLML